MSFAEQVLVALREADVDFVVVGGIAVVLHGYLRLTADVDIVLNLADDGNVRKALAVMESLGLVPRLPVPASSFADRAIREQWIEKKNMEVFTFLDEVNPLRVVDFFARSPIPYGELAARASIVRLAGHGIPTASIEDLIAMKRKVGRPQDLVDIEKLEEIRGIRGEG